jgi:hypothetical protein
MIAMHGEKVTDKDNQLAIPISKPLKVLDGDLPPYPTTWVISYNQSFFDDLPRATVAIAVMHAFGSRSKRDESPSAPRFAIVRKLLFKSFRDVSSMLRTNHAGLILKISLIISMNSTRLA